MNLKKLIKKLIDINVLIFVKILTQLRIGRYFLYKLNNKIISEKTSLDYNNVGAFENYYNYIWVRD